MSRRRLWSPDRKAPSGGMTVCARCGLTVGTSGLASHLRGKACRTLAYARSMRARGWIVLGIDFRGWGVPGEHGPNPIPVVGGDVLVAVDFSRYGVWHPAWVKEFNAALMDTSITGTRAFQAAWSRAAADADWRDAVVAAYIAGGGYAAELIIQEELKRARR